MARTDNLRKQHVEILQLAREINARLSAQLDPEDAAAIRPLLAKLAGLVSLHLAIEDRSLYPALAAHADPEARMLSKRYMDEMGGLPPRSTTTSRTGRPRRTCSRTRPLSLPPARPCSIS